MATAYTPNALLAKPATADRNWDVQLNANVDILDSLAPIGGLLVTSTEVPSSSLNVRVTPGGYAKFDGGVGTFSGSNLVSLPPSGTSCLWLTNDGVLNITSQFPTTPHVRLAQVTTGATIVQAIVDARIVASTCGIGAQSVLTVGGPLSVLSADNVTNLLAVNPTNGIGFFGVAPTGQTPSVATVLDQSNGVPSTGVVDVGSPASSSIINNNFSTLASRINSLITALKHNGLMAS